MQFLSRDIAYNGRRSYGTESTSTSSTSTGSGGSGGGGGVGGRYIPYSVNDEGQWVIENGYGVDESGNTVFGADIVVPGHLIAWGESSAYQSGSTSGGSGGGSVVSIEQVLTSGTESAILTIDGESTTIYTLAGGGGGSYTAGSGISINANDVISLNSATIGILDSVSGKASNADLTAHTSNSTIHVTQTNKNTWNGKQDKINDLSTIRANAASGASAYTALTANYYTSAQTDNAIYSGIQDVTGQLNNNFWGFAYNADLTAHTANTAIHRTSADTKQQIDTALQPYFTSAQTDERYVNVGSAQTITGAKTFSAKTKVNNDLDVLEDITASGNIKSFGEVYCYGTSEVTVAPLITVNPIYSAGTLVCTITVAGQTYNIYVPETTTTTTPSPL